MSRLNVANYRHPDASSDSFNLNSDASFTLSGGVSSTERTITTGSWDLATGNFWTCGAITIPSPTNAVAGTGGLIRVTAAPTFPTECKFPGGTYTCLLYTSPSPRDLSTSRMPSSA